MGTYFKLITQSNVSPSHKCLKKIQALSVSVSGLRISIVKTQYTVHSSKLDRQDYLGQVGFFLLLFLPG